MEASEFRIGNLVTDNFKVGKKVDRQLTIDDFVAMSNFIASGSPIPYLPIPLTEEWLKGVANFATPIDGLDGNSIRYLRHMSGFELSGSDDLGWAVSVNLFECEVTPPIKFVHDLQNAFYVFQREELKLK